jgi:hypothetical protein
MLEEAAWGEEGDAALSWAVLVEAEAAKAVEGGALVDGVQAVAEGAAARSCVVMVEAEAAACTRAIRRGGRTSVPWRRSHASVAGTKPKSSPTPPKTMRPTPSIAVPAPSIRATGAAPS